MAATLDKGCDLAPYMKSVRHPLPDIAPGEAVRECDTVPMPWNATPLCRLLTEEQCGKVRAILNTNRDNLPGQLSGLKEYFRTIKPELERQDIDGTFLAYTIIGSVNQFPH
jgi:hypothetical protein